MTRFPQVLVNVPVRERLPNAAELLADEITAVEARLSGSGRVLLRPSGTEPLVRVMVEAREDAIAHDAADHLAALVASRWGKRRPLRQPRFASIAVLGGFQLGNAPVRRPVRMMRRKPPRSPSPAARSMFGA